MFKRLAARRLALAACLTLLVGLGLYAPTTPLLDSSAVAEAAVSTSDMVVTQEQSGTSNSRVGVLKSTGSFTPVSVGAARSGAISANGAKIAFQSDATLHQNNGVFIVNSDGSGLLQITPNTPESEWFTSTDCIDEEPALSPTGSTVAFDHRCYPDINTPKLWVRNADGTGMRKLTTENASYQPASENSATFSPDGTKVAFIAGNSTVGYGIYKVSSTTTSVPTRLASVGPQNELGHPYWVGNRIYFPAKNNINGNHNLFWVKDDGTGTPTNVMPSLSLDCSQGSPAPDYATALCSAYSSSGNQIFRLDVAAQTLTQVSNDGGNGYIYEEPVPIRGIWPAATAKTVVALGDSVAGGEGINYGITWSATTGHWSDPTDPNPLWTNTAAARTSNYQQCHQSDQAYGRMLYANGYKVLNFACTGASAMNGILKAETFSNGSPTVPAQLGGTCTGCAAVNAQYDADNPDVVTLTMGADDINFSYWIATCYGGTINCGSATDTNTVNSALTGAKLDLRTTLREIDRRAALKGKKVRVVVTNYYDPFTTPYSDCADTSASVFHGDYPWIGITTSEEVWLESGLSQLNTNISSEVTYATANFTHISVKFADVSHIMNGHQYCNSDPWVYGPSIDYGGYYALTGGNSPAPFHPTPAGQRAIYNVVATAVTAP